VGARDRKYQVWERNALSFPLISHGVINQKFDYIHMNPVKAGLCKFPWDYKYSSADYYYNEGNDLGFLSSI
jgi:putative transposase